MSALPTNHKFSRVQGLFFTDYGIHYLSLLKKWTCCSERVVQSGAIQNWLISISPPSAPAPCKIHTHYESLKFHWLYSTCKAQENVIIDTNALQCKTFRKTACRIVLYPWDVFWQHTFRICWSCEYVAGVTARASKMLRHALQYINNKPSTNHKHCTNPPQGGSLTPSMGMSISLRRDTQVVCCSLVSSIVSYYFRHLQHHICKRISEGSLQYCFKYFCSQGLHQGWWTWALQLFVRFIYYSYISDPLAPIGCVKVASSE